jgi:N-acetyl-anhydromuramyl-L-alanine amidase AmpD
MKIIDKPLSKKQYMQEVYTKNQIYLHHTVSSSESVQGDYEWWEQTPDRVATAYIIRGDGQIFRLFDDKFWAHHLGLKTANNTNLNRASIGIELDSAGQLKYDKGQYISSFGKVIPPERVQFYPNGFRGFMYFEKYSDAQIASLKELLLDLGKRYKINLKYSDAIWDMNKDALSGVNGLYAHVSVRKDKSDAHCQPELIAMLKTL